MTRFIYPRFSAGGPRSYNETYGGRPFYFEEGFLPIQDAVARSFTEQKCLDLTECRNGTLRSIKMQRTPYPPYVLDILLQGLETLVSFFILLSFVYPCINTVRFIAVEKERQLKESMKIMGLASWLHWTTWFLWIMILMTVSISIMVALLKVRFFFYSFASNS